MMQIDGHLSYMNVKRANLVSVRHVTQIGRFGIPSPYMPTNPELRRPILRHNKV
jgi:hypothetical protein